MHSRTAAYAQRRAAAGREYWLRSAGITAAREAFGGRDLYAVTTSIFRGGQNSMFNLSRG
jgi:hypothetical protein